MGVSNHYRAESPTITRFCAPVPQGLRLAGCFAEVSVSLNPPKWVFRAYPEFAPKDSGMTTDEVARELFSTLPQVMDRLSPQGTLPAQNPFAGGSSALTEMIE